MAKPETHYLIDGYNVIHSWPDLKNRTEDLAEVRDRLVDVLTEYGAYEHYQLTIVFDALFTADEEHIENPAALVTVVYTGAGETADSYIERRAYELAHGGHEVFAVTSDGAEQSVVLGAGGYRIPSLELYRRVKAVKEKLRSQYLGKVSLPYTRNDVAGRLDSETAAKLDRLRRGLEYE